jgi:hypothetical protein
MQDFKEGKKSGRVKVIAVTAEELRIETKQFDATTGKEIEPKVDVYLKSTLKTNRDALQSQIDNIDALLEEFKK